MTKYASEAADALSDIADAGAAVTFKRADGTPVYDSTTGRWTKSPDTTASGSAMQVRGDPDRFAALSLVLVDPVTLLVAASGLAITPQPGDSMVWAGATYTVKDVDPTGPDGTAIFYRIIGSRG